MFLVTIKVKVVLIVITLPHLMWRLDLMHSIIMVRRSINNTLLNLLSCLCLNSWYTRWWLSRICRGYYNVSSTIDWITLVLALDTIFIVMVLSLWKWGASRSTFNTLSWLAYLLVLIQDLLLTQGLTTVLLIHIILIFITFQLSRLCNHHSIYMLHGLWMLVL